MYVSDEVLEETDKTEDKISDLFDEWNMYIRKRTKELLLNNNSVECKIELKIAKKFVDLLENVPISMLEKMENFMDYELQAIMYFLNDLDIDDEKSTIETINHKGLELTI